MQDPSIFPSIFIAPETISAAKFSPFSANKILLAASQHFGIVGTGNLTLIQVFFMLTLGN